MEVDGTRSPRYATAVAVRLPRRAYLAIGEVLTHPRFHPIHRRLYRWAGGRGPLSRALGVDMILVTGRGRRTGASRTVPLAAVPDGRAWIVVGSNAGKPETPGWVHNLRAHPHVRVEHRARSATYVASEPHPGDAGRLWDSLTAAYPGFAVYRSRASRQIPLFILEPLGED